MTKIAISANGRTLSEREAQRRSRSPFVVQVSFRFLVPRSVGRKLRIRIEKRRRMTSKGFVELKKRTVCGIGYVKRTAFGKFSLSQ